MGFDLPSLLATRRGEGYDLHARYLNPQLPRMLHAIGFDKVYERAEGAYLWDRDGNRYADFLAGFGVFGVGHNHPVVRKALHDMLDAELPSMVQFDCALLPGLLAERLLAQAPEFDRVYFGNSGTEAVETALKFARYATGRKRILLLQPRLPRPDHRLAVGQRCGGVPQGLRPAAPGRRDPVRRHRRARGRAAQGRRRGARRRADSGQGRLDAARRVPHRGRASCCMTTARC